MNLTIGKILQKHHEIAIKHTDLYTYDEPDIKSEDSAILSGLLAKSALHDQFAKDALNCIDCQFVYQ